MNRLIEPIEIQRLIDGLLDVDEQAALIQWAEEYPENWRTLAHAFIENGNLQRAWEPSQGEDGHAAFQPCRDRLPHRDRPRSEQRQERSRSWAIGIAAALLITLTNGWLIHRFRVRPDRAGTSLEVVNANYPELEGSSLVAGEPSDVASQPNQNPTSLESLPIEQTDPFERWASSVSTPLIAPALKELLARRGVIAVEQPVIYIFEGDEGNDYVVPNREATLISHQK